MKRKLILMYVNNYLASLLLLTGLFFPGAVFAVTGAVHDVHRLPGNDEFQRTIEARCTICHTRARVDQAIGEKVDIDVLLQQMIERGAILNEADRNVLGTFWGSPIKDADGEQKSAAPQ